jgi:hypothetical protein
MSNNISLFGTSELTIKTNPTITFDNGMVLWLAKEGESVEINTYDWNIIQRMNKDVSLLGIYKDVLVDKSETIINKNIKKETNTFLSTLKQIFL